MRCPSGQLIKETVITEFLRLASDFDGFDPGDSNPVSRRLIFQYRLKVRRDFDHRHMRERKPLIDKGVIAVRQIETLSLPTYAPQHVVNCPSNEWNICGTFIAP